MKKCIYCGKEYPDEATVCAIDGQPLTGGSKAESFSREKSEAAPRPINPALMVKLRSLHLYLGCIFAPMLLLFAISGIWQTLHLQGSARILAMLSSIHVSGNKGGHSLSSVPMMIFVLLMSVSFIITTILGIIMAVNYGRNRRAAYYCLGFGVVFPLLLVVLHSL